MNDAINIRVAPIGTPPVYSLSLARWTTWSITPTDWERNALRDLHGTKLRICPADYGALAALSLAFQVDGAGKPDLSKPLVEVP